MVSAFLRTCVSANPDGSPITTALPLPISVLGTQRASIQSILLIVMGVLIAGGIWYYRVRYAPSIPAMLTGTVPQAQQAEPNHCLSDSLPPSQCHVTPERAKRESKTNASSAKCCSGASFTGLERKPVSASAAAMPPHAQRMMSFPGCHFRMAMSPLLALARMEIRIDRPRIKFEGPCATETVERSLCSIQQPYPER